LGNYGEKQLRRVLSSLLGLGELGKQKVPGYFQKTERGEKGEFIGQYFGTELVSIGS
jgi:hypothetical protein